MMITPQLKDEILNFIGKEVQPGQFVLIPTNEIVKSTGISSKYIDPVLKQFERLGLIEEYAQSAHGFSFIVNADVHDFLLRGGFSVKEELLEKNIEKLLLEIEDLKKKISPDQTERLNRVSQIAQGVAASLQILTMIK